MTYLGYVSVKSQSTSVWKISSKQGANVGLEVWGASSQKWQPRGRSVWVLLPRE